MELIVEGDLSPSAARVAEEAGIGLRTVFRHFDDMDALYAEITATITEEVMPIVMAPYPDQPWQGNIRELVGWRTLRHDQSLSAEDAGAVMERMVEAQLAAIAAD